MEEGLYDLVCETAVPYLVHFANKGIVPQILDVEAARR
jgi:hypothetical protein